MTTLLNEGKSIIVIEGNIGTGKSTLINNIKNYITKYIENIENKIEFNCEPLDEWNILLNNFYENPKRWAFTFQIKILLYHVKLLDNFNSNKKKIILLERFFLSSVKIFSQILLNNNNLNDSEFEIINDLYEHILLKISNYNINIIYIYLKTDPNICLQRIIKRNRICEKNINIDYLNQLNNLYDKNFINNSIIIDNNLDKSMGGKKSPHEFNIPQSIINILNKLI
tara:strand:- start:9257 stop:9934 length:678 start_codon:yes stop_codon:yes gene_type:complete